MNKDKLQAVTFKARPERQLHKTFKTGWRTQRRGHGRRHSSRPWARQKGRGGCEGASQAGIAARRISCIPPPDSAVRASPGCTSAARREVHLADDDAYSILWLQHVAAGLDPRYFPYPCFYGTLCPLQPAAQPAPKPAPEEPVKKDDGSKKEQPQNNPKSDGEQPKEQQKEQPKEQADAPSEPAKEQDTEQEAKEVKKEVCVRAAIA